MSAPSIYLAVVLAAALVSFWLHKLRPDVTALLVMLALLVPWQATPEGLQAILSPTQAFAGFGSPAVVMVAAMFVLSAAMVRTGAAQQLGGRLLAWGAASELRFQLTILGAVTVFSGFVNDTTTVLVWMPLVMAICRERGYAPSRVLLVLAFASLLGGQWTLIGTRSNVILSDYLRERTGDGLGFFAFTPIAAVIWLACGAWFALVGRRMLPAAVPKPTLESRYDVTEFTTETMAEADSALVGKSLDELDLRARDLNVLQVIRGDEFLPAAPWLRVHAGDVLVIQGRVTAITELLTTTGLRVREELRIDEKMLRSPDLRMVEAVLRPGSALQHRSLVDLDFHHRYGVSALAISRQGRSIRERPLHVRLEAGDSLLLVGHEEELQRLREDHDLMLLESRPVPAANRRSAWLVLGIVAAMVLSGGTGLLPIAVAVPAAAMVAVLTGCVGMRTAYEAIDLQAIVIVGAMISFGAALEQTHTAQWMAETLVASLPDSSPLLLFAAVLLLALLMTQVIENAAVAAVLAPIAYAVAQVSGADPAPFLLGVAIVVSAAFTTPVAHESTILVMGPGRYRFRDYTTLGVPFALLTWLVTVLVLPLWWPLTPG